MELHRNYIFCRHGTVQEQLGRVSTLLYPLEKEPRRVVPSKNLEHSKQVFEVLNLKLNLQSLHLLEQENNLRYRNMLA